MNVTVNSQKLAAELRLLNKIVPSKPVIQILSHVMLTVDDRRLQLTTTDLEVTLVATCEAQIVAQGSVALPAGKLLSMCEQFTEDDVTITLDKRVARVTCGAFSSRLQALQPDDWPVSPTVEGASAVLRASDLDLLIGRMRYVIAGASANALTRGALLTVGDRGVAMVALDGKRLSVATAYKQSGGDISVIVPHKTLDVLAGSPNAGDVEVLSSGQHLFFRLGDRLLISRTIDGKFPAYERIIPRGGAMVMTIDRLGLAAVLRRVGLAADENLAVRFAFAEGSLDVTASSSHVGDAQERVAVGYAGDPVRICCNWQYVLDFLEAAHGQTVTWTASDAMSPILLADGPSFVNVVMPMRG